MVEAYCAGYAAMIAAGYTEEIAVEGCTDDFENATHLIQYWGLEGSIEDWKGRAVALLNTPENKHAVRPHRRAITEVQDAPEQVGSSCPAS